MIVWIVLRSIKSDSLLYHFSLDWSMEKKKCSYIIGERSRRPSRSTKGSPPLTETKAWRFQPSPWSSSHVAPRGHTMSDVSPCTFPWRWQRDARQKFGNSYFVFFQDSVCRKTFVSIMNPESNNLFSQILTFFVWHSCTLWTTNLPHARRTLNHYTTQPRFGQKYPHAFSMHLGSPNFLRFRSTMSIFWLMPDFVYSEPWPQNGLDMFKFKSTHMSSICPPPTSEAQILSVSP